MRDRMRSRMERFHGEVLRLLYVEAIVVKALFETRYGTCLDVPIADDHTENGRRYIEVLAIYNAVERVIENLGQLQNHSQLSFDELLIVQMLEKDLQTLDSFEEDKLKVVFSGSINGWFGRCNPGSGAIPTLTLSVMGWTLNPDRSIPSDITTMYETILQTYGSPIPARIDVVVSLGSR